MHNSINMGRLIPLRLRPSSASTDTIRRSLTSSPSTPPPAIPAKSTLQPRSELVTNLTVFPYTEDEWGEVIEEVRTLHLKRQYKQCSTRCTQILENVKDPHRVHPIYQIYLYFFAASSLEETARCLPPHSFTKLPLLQQSLAHYQNAQSHMEYASFATDPTIIQAVRKTRNNSISSFSSSVRSSMDSIFSQTSSVSSCASVASATMCSTAETPTHKRALSTPPSSAQPGMAPAPLKFTKKKVSFSLQLPNVLSNAKLDLTDDSTLLSYFPTPPSTNLPPSPPPSPDSIAAFVLSRTLLRYRNHLSDLHAQLNYHIRSVVNQVTALQKIRKARRSNLPALFTDFGSGLDGKGVDGVMEEERRQVEVRARIERLKENGWRRERFDGAQYKTLCERALGELN